MVVQELSSGLRRTLPGSRAKLLSPTLHSTCSLRHTGPSQGGRSQCWSMSSQLSNDLWTRTGRPPKCGWVVATVSLERAMWKGESMMRKPTTETVAAGSSASMRAMARDR